MLKYLKKKNLKIGILGGSFDPPHKGHIAISKFALKELKLNHVIWIVTKKNPLKFKPYYNTEERIILCKKIVKNFKKIKIEYLDEVVESSSTYKLLQYLKNFNRSLKFFFIIGADNLVNLDKWYQWQKIPKIAKIIVFNRQSFSIKALNSIAAKKLKKNEWMFINSKEVNISSSKIKKI